MQGHGAVRERHGGGAAGGASPCGAWCVGFGLQVVEQAWACVLESSLAEWRPAAVGLTR